MKERFAAATEYPVAIRSRGTARNRGYKPWDAKKTKRVRFDDTEMDSGPDYASIRERKMTQSPRSDAPKTSEYAYFRNIKNGAVHDRSRSYDRDNGLLKNSKTNQRGREGIKPSDILKINSKDLKFSVCRETAAHSDNRFLLTPPVTKYEEPSRGDIKDLTKDIRERPLLLSKNVTPVGRISSLSTLSEASGNASLSGDLETNATRGIFSAKRRRLRQWAHNSNSEVEKLHPEGVGLISSLLGRLYPDCDESDLFYLQDSSKEETDNGCEAPNFHESKNLGESLHLSHKREWDTELPKIRFGRYKNRVFLEQNAYFSGSPFANCGPETHFKNEITDLHYGSEYHESSSPHAGHDLPFCLPLERYGYSGSCFLKELDGSCYPIERQRKEPHRFSLNWDFEREKDVVSSSIINYDPTKNAPGLSTTWNVNHQQIEEHVPDAKALCSPSLFSNYYLESNSIQSYPSSSCFTPDFLPIFDEAKLLVPETDMFLTFASTPKCISLAKDTNSENIPCSSNMIFSYGNQRWLQNKAWDSKPHSDFWWKGFKGDGFSPQNPSIFRTWQFPQVDDSLCSFSVPKEAPGDTFTLCSKGTIHNHSWFLNFPSSLDSRINCPLLLDNVSNDWSDREVYFDDDNKWNYIVDVVP